MFFYSDRDPATWGANLPGSPVLGADDTLEHLTTFVVVLQRGQTERNITKALLGSIILSTDTPTGPFRTRSFDDAVGWCDRS